MSQYKEIRFRISAGEVRQCQRVIKARHDRSEVDDADAEIAEQILKDLTLEFKSQKKAPTYALRKIDNPMEFERKCVYCGCTDAAACLGGCSWIEKHKATPTGVCSACAPKLLKTADRL